MKKIIAMTGFVLTLMVLTGCGEETKSVDWWVSHPKEATEKYVDCQKTGSDSDNCKNVKKAALIISDSYQPMNDVLKKESQEIKRKLGLIK
ncbi:TPA: EexN family lipoprotein [Klebsiella pneumoniae subsp. pneumoniae]|nr:EexN family lipoprotein [Salmonella enterica]HDS4694729.1 EexN family lipoprotein [Klebsiella pneumoniae subsp. pneumoniae]